MSIQMEWVIILFGVLLVIGIKAFWDERNYKKKTIRALKKEWGQIRDEDVSYEKMQSLSSYYNTLRDDSVDVDDITWNDLDMESVFYLLNHTESAIGEEYLYSVLRKPLFSDGVLRERNRITQFFMEREDERISFQMALRRMGKIKNISVHEYINKMEMVSYKDSLKHILYDVALIASVGLTIFVSPIFSLSIVAMVMNNMITYYKRKGEIEKYYNVISCILRVLYGIGDIAKINIEELKEYRERLVKAKRAFKKFSDGSFWIFSGRRGNESILDFFMNYVQLLFHIDLIKFNTMMEEMRKNREVLNEIFEVVGVLDSAIAIASFRTYLGSDYCLPELTREKEVVMEANGLFHPLIEEPISNSIIERKAVLLTGSNASGKSTFLKTVAINAILSQTIFTSLCSRYRASYFKVFSSMALRDDLFSKESYFIVEIKSLKRILDHMEDDKPMLCLIDEVLRGTNTLERIASSSQILYQVSNCNALCFAATHDIELTYILENHYSNYHFREEVVGNEVLFDYKLYKGRATSRNAIKLLGIIGYKPEIIENAVEEVKIFENEGRWRKIK